MRQFAGYLVAAMVLVSVSGCSQRPEEEMESANEALNEARAAEADRYASEVYQEAVDAFESAKAEIQAQDEKFFMTRSYGEARNLLRTATATANRAAEESAAGREQARQEAETAIQQARTALDAAQASVKQAPRGKGSQADIDAMNAELAVLQTTLDEAQSAYEGGDYLTALTKAESVSSDASSIRQDIEQARKKAT